MKQCRRCRGRGYTPQEATEMVADKDGALKTVKQGSGCRVCRGKGWLKIEQIKAMTRRRSFR